jgi:hypothetical protein
MHTTNPHLSAAPARHLTEHGSHQNEDGTYTWKFDNYTHAHPAYDIGSDDTEALWRDIACPVLCINAGQGTRIVSARPTPSRIFATPAC